MNIDVDEGVAGGQHPVVELARPTAPWRGYRHFLHMTLAGDSYNSIHGRLKAVISWPGENIDWRTGGSTVSAVNAIKRGWVNHADLADRGIGT